jgi:NadR type nicotinamide-nucleotide adenylyltransferase
MSSKKKIKKIAVTGPESTGKSALAQLLADHYLTVWVPEFARVYLLQQDRPYNYSDILKIARGQRKSERALAKIARKIMFSDTELLVTKIWCDVKYGVCHQWILDGIEMQSYDLYLLCDVDLPWEPDPLREHPDSRKYLFDLYRKELDERKLNYRVVSGLDDARFKNALGFVEEILKSE